MKHPSKVFKNLCLVSLCAGAAPLAVATVNTEDLYSLSLKELMEVAVSTGSIRAGTAKDAPSAITVITQNDIELSGAKNLATLMEQHVPGLMVMNHSEGNKIGIRGHIAAENYKLLLLVNGKNVTNMVYEGVIPKLTSGSWVILPELKWSVGQGR
jgi:outer membrane receptor for ferrienterochelin and colicin